MSKRKQANNKDNKEISNSVVSSKKSGDKAKDDSKVRFQNHCSITKQ